MQKIFLSLALMMAVAVLAAGPFQPPNVKVGLWQTTGTTTTHGIMPFPEDLLRKMAPEQRDRVESKMQADTAGRTTTRTYKTCLTQSQLDDWKLYDNFEKDCKQSIDTSTGSRLDGHWDCDFGGGVIGTGVIHLEVINPQSTKGTIHMIAHGNGHEFTSDATISSKWLGAHCGDVK
jgi:hypothetical protein